MLRSTLSRVIPALLVLLSLSPLYLALYTIGIYRRSGLPLAAIITAGTPHLLRVVEYLAAAFLYWRLTNPRMIFQILGIVYGAIYIPTLIDSRNFVGSWSVLHGNIIGIAAWEAVGVVLLGVLCAIHLATDLAAMRLGRDITA